MGKNIYKKNMNETDNDICRTRIKTGPVKIMENIVERYF